MATNLSDSKQSLMMILKQQPYLYDLHTHLLGMGNAGFWVDTILMDASVMPTNDSFKGDQNLCKNLGPLVWNQSSNNGFVNIAKSAKFFNHLVENNIFIKSNREQNMTTTTTTSLKNAEESLKIFPSYLKMLINENLYTELINKGLEFASNFSYDVILTLEDLSKALGVKYSHSDGIAELAVIEKLGVHLLKEPPTFQHWIIFNARKQQFEVVYGIPVETLRKLIYVDPNAPSEAAKLARAHIVNAFSMCDSQGTTPRPVDFHSFHGSFTPEFYPRRFALKDSIYSQRLDILASLLANIIERYRTCLPPVTYCEFSISINDLLKPWVFDVLRSVKIYNVQTIDRIRNRSQEYITNYKAKSKLSSFAQIILSGGFPHLHAAFEGPTFSHANETEKYNALEVSYKFLAGFDRQKIKFPFPTDQDDGLRLLYNAPHEAILLMMNEIQKSVKDKNELTTDGAQNGFDPCLEKLKELSTIGKKNAFIYEWIVGLDLFGDELGYPYCPFVARPFIKFIEERRKKNKYFGVRVHCGENVKYADESSLVYRLFIAHMFIVFRCLLFLHQELKYGIRVGHGIAFNRILQANLNASKFRKSSVLLADMQYWARYLFKHIAFEVNLTSNEYLLGQTLRDGNFAKILSLEKLFEIEAPIILATDDDGIWPIDQCPTVHPGHHSLAAEYCRAISTSLIDSKKNLISIFKAMEKFCFSDMNNPMQQSLIKITGKKEVNDSWMSNIVIHPNIIKEINMEHNKLKPIMPMIVKKYLWNHKLTNGFSLDNVNWKNPKTAMHVVFICICFGLVDSDKNKLYSIYKNVFRSCVFKKEAFDSVYDTCRDIFKIVVNYDTNIDFKINIEYPKPNNRTNDVFYSLSSTENELKNILENINSLETNINVRIYANELNIDRTKTTIEALPCGKTNGTIAVFTNTNKYKYAFSKFGEDLAFHLNPQASKRFSNQTDENYVYVLCHHARAVTAFLNFFIRQMSKYLEDITKSSSTGLEAELNEDMNYSTVPRNNKNQTTADPIPRFLNSDDSSLTN